MTAAVSVNIAERLRATAARNHDGVAMVFIKEGRRMSFGNWTPTATAWPPAQAHGLTAGMRVGVMVRPPTLRRGLRPVPPGPVPVLIDPGLGRSLRPA